ncbi:MAG: hypothetical protein QM725_01190 [Lacibacter sp.]
MNKTNFLTAAVVLLVILNGVTLYFLFSKPQRKTSRNGGRPFTEFISKQLNFDSAQAAQLQVLRDAHKANLEALKKEDKILHDSLFVFVKRGDMDSVKIDSFLNLITINKKKFELAFMQNFAQIRKLCRPEQIELFNKMVDQMMKKRMPENQNRKEEKKDNLRNE